MGDNLFKNEGAPSLSFKDAPIGTVLGGRVSSEPQLVQARDYDTGEPAWWDKEETQPKMAVTLKVVTEAGDERSIWAVKPSAMFTAFAKATEDLGRGVEINDVVWVKLTGTKPNAKNPRLADQKLYAVKIVAGKPADPFAETAERAVAAARAADTAVEVAPAASAFSDEPPF